MKKIVCLFLALLLTLSAVGALAELDFHDYSQFPLCEDGSVTIKVVTMRSDADGIEIEYATGVHFEVEQILSSVRDEKLSLLFASGELPDLIYGLGLSTSELVRYGQSEGLLMPLNEYITPEIMPNACAWFEKYPQALAFSTAPTAMSTRFRAPTTRAYWRRATRTIFCWARSAGSCSQPFAAAARRARGPARMR